MQRTILIYFSSGFFALAGWQQHSKSGLSVGFEPAIKFSDSRQDENEGVALASPLPQQSNSKNELADFDPYFSESSEITTSYGPNRITRNILQDRNGDIWLATWLGIIRYDGKSFTNFTNQEGLRRFRVFSILEDRNGNIWFGTIGAGAYRYDGESFTNFTAKKGLVNDRVGVIYEDKTGNIWFGTEGGASRYDGKSFQNFTTNEGLTNNDINSITEDESGKFWFGTRGDACTFDGKTFTRLTNEAGSAFENVRSIMEDTEGNIWLGGNDGLWRYHDDSFSNFTTSFVGYIYEDKKGNIWTSSEARTDQDQPNPHQWVLSRYDEQSLHHEKAAATQILTRDGMFFGIVEDRDGGIWVGSLDGVCRYDGKTFKYFNDSGKER